MNNNEEPGDIDVHEITTFYDSVYYANAIAKDSHIRGHYSRLYKKLGIEASDQVLDVACGTGGWLKVCHDNGARVSGVDLSKKAIGICKELMPDGEFYAQPAETLPFADNRFDLVTCLGSLEHFIEPVSSLREMTRVAKPDAAFIILVPNLDFLTRKLRLFSGTYQVDAREIVRTLEEWQSMFAQAGLVVDERWRDLHILNRQWITSGKWYTWPLRLMQALVLPLWPMRWQYQVYHHCSLQDSADIDSHAR